MWESTIERIEDRIEEATEMTIDELCNEGYSISKIYKQFGISPTSLNNYLREVRPDLIPFFKHNGTINKASAGRILTAGQLKKILKLSKQGMGIDALGKLFGVDGTTIRYNLIKHLGEEEYHKRHPISRYTDNNGWNGKSLKYKGENYQSVGEVYIVKILEKYNLFFDAHKRLVLNKRVFYPDFYIQSLDLYIEFVGMLDVNYYKTKFFRKVNYYSLNNIKFLIVDFDSLKSFESILKGVMREDVISY